MEEFHTDLLRNAGPGRRLHLALSLSTTALTLARRGLARSRKGMSNRDLGIEFVAIHYGRDLAEGGVAVT